jgi:hypothetical protein
MKTDGTTKAFLILVVVDAEARWAGACRPAKR